MSDPILVLLFRATLDRANPDKSPEWVDERAHVECYAAVDVVLAAVLPDSYPDAARDRIEDGACYGE